MPFGKKPAAGGARAVGGESARAAEHTENNADQEFIVHNIPPFRKYYVPIFVVLYKQR